MPVTHRVVGVIVLELQPVQLRVQVDQELLEDQQRHAPLALLAEEVLEQPRLVLPTSRSSRDFHTVLWQQEAGAESVLLR